MVSGPLLGSIAVAVLLLDWRRSFRGPDDSRSGGSQRSRHSVGGLALVDPSVAEQTAVQNELARGDGVPTQVQRQRLEHADRLMRHATRIDLPLILLAGLTMAVGRYQ